MSTRRQNVTSKTAWIFSARNSFPRGEGEESDPYFEQFWRWRVDGAYLSFTWSGVEVQGRLVASSSSYMEKKTKRIMDSPCCLFFSHLNFESASSISVKFTWSLLHRRLPQTGAFQFLQWDGGPLGGVSRDTVPLAVATQMRWATFIIWGRICRFVVVIFSKCMQ